MIINKNSKTPLCQQFDSFFKALLDSLKKGDLIVYESIEQLKPKTTEDFIPNKSEYIMLRAKDFTAYANLSDDVKEKMLGTMFDMEGEDYFEDRCVAYVKKLEQIFDMILKQLHKSIISDLVSRENWRDISMEKDTIELLKTLREVCYGIGEETDEVILALDRKLNIEQFFSCTQKNGQPVEDYIDEVESYYNVLKLHGGGGGVFQSEPLKDLTIKRMFPDSKGVDFDSLGDGAKRKIEEYMDRIVVSGVIVGGSKSSWKNSHIRKYAEVAEVQLNLRKAKLCAPIQVLKVNGIDEKFVFQRRLLAAGRDLTTSSPLVDRFVRNLYGDFPLGLSPIHFDDRW